MLSGTTRTAAWLLAGLTSLLLVVTSVLLVDAWRGRAVEPAAAGPVLERHGVRVPLPVGATVLAPDERLFYAGDDGRAVAAVRGAAVLVPGACAGDADSSRGFVGVVPSGGPVARVHASLVRSWRQGLGRAVGSHPRASPVEVDEGVRTDLVAEVRVDAPCQPERVRASLLTLPGRDGGRPVTVVLVRDVGVSDEIGDGVAELVLAGVAVGR